jgi:hypothetical protein
MYTDNSHKVARAYKNSSTDVIGHALRKPAQSNFSFFLFPFFFPFLPNSQSRQRLFLVRSDSQGHTYK